MATIVERNTTTYNTRGSKNRLKKFTVHPTTSLIVCVWNRFGETVIIVAEMKSWKLKAALFHSLLLLYARRDKHTRKNKASSYMHTISEVFRGKLSPSRFRFNYAL